MSGEKYVGAISHMLSTVQAAGCVGFGLEICMLGDYRENPGQFTAELKKRNLELGALALVCHWLEPVETEEERREADWAIEYLRRFPGTLLCLCQYPGKDRSNLAERQKNAISCVNAVAKRVADKGIVSAFHPNSPPGSVFRVEDDYAILMEGLDTSVVGFAPDAGHIANGDMDVLSTFKTYRESIRHVHFKDIAADGAWAAMGEGVLDWPTLVSFLESTGYEGWIMIEEESKPAESDPDEIILKNGRYVTETLLPIVQS
jgi:inosose dehydratase